MKFARNNRIEASRIFGQTQIMQTAEILWAPAARFNSMQTGISSIVMPTFNQLDESACWDAVQRRDSAQDGKFFMGVVTTGVYCRPSCTARHALRKNVRFYSNPAEAERDGLRPCLRCRPLATVNKDPNAERIRKICRYIEAHVSDPDAGAMSLDQLAGRAELSRFHFQRSFQSIVGVTPKQYVEACRMKQLKANLRQSDNVTGAIYDAGFGSSSRVYERADGYLGMTPKQYRDGGSNLIVTYTTVDSPAGKIMIGATDRGICFVQFGADDEELLRALEKEYPAALLEPMREPAPPVFRQWIASLSAHLAGRQPHLELPLDIRATAFQMRVWNYLQSIPYGETRSYSEVAEAIGKPSATRAVANACAKNTVAILIPCHRVIREGGDLGGYRWGLPRKQQLIAREQTVKNRTTAPGKL
jgi:AraC family transcriptional regulator of adaptative response/methylated-DNA-[protein]-cysteine methyltransferase